MALKGNAEIPQRSCLGCRTSKDKNVLMRFVLTPDLEVLPDLENKLPGRGAYTCFDRKCLALAVNQRQFKRSFKQDVSVMSAEKLIDHVSQQLHARIIGLIGLANKAGMVTGGGSMVLEALKSKKKPGLVIIAGDVSEAIGDKIRHASAAQKVPFLTAITKDDFGAILGKAPRSAISVASGGFVAQMTRAIERYSNFLGEV
jgi:predicted RNA-binding protein YlxR (DUF448 family)/vacuolar-type H+-ATPase subunit F/Vma7